MKSGIRSEIHFHEQDCTSVFTEASLPRDYRHVWEIQLFVHFAIRQMLCVGQPAVPLAQGLRYGPKVGTPEFAAEMEVLRIVPYPGHKGRKYFTLQFVGNDDRKHFAMKAHGFGLMYRGINYYAPMSVMAFLEVLAAEHRDNPDYLAALSCAASLCGFVHLNNEIRVDNQEKLAVGISDQALRHLTLATAHVE
jgi:hypothetical protein